MTAMTRSASMVPLSMSCARPDASETLSIATLWTSTGSGIWLSSVEFISDLDDGAGGAVHRFADALQRRDDRPGAATLDEPHGGLHLGAHAAAGEMARRRVFAHLCRRHPLERPRVGGAVGQHRVVNVGRDDEHVGPHGRGENGRREVLVDHGLDAAQGAVGISYNGNAPAA